jgi:hypothetical protein
MNIGEMSLLFCPIHRNLDWKTTAETTDRNIAALLYSVLSTQYSGETSPCLSKPVSRTYFSRLHWVMWAKLLKISCAYLKIVTPYIIPFNCWLYQSCHIIPTPAPATYIPTLVGALWYHKIDVLSDMVNKPDHTVLFSDRNSTI